MEIEPALKSNQVILYSMPSSEMTERIPKILKQLSSKRVAVVSLNKTYESIIELCKKHKIPTKNCFFIDCISKTIKEVGDHRHVVFCTAPSALTEISLVLTEVIDSGEIDYIVFDSLSTLNVYADEVGEAGFRFAAHIMNKVRDSKTKLIWVCVDSDLKKGLVKEVSLHVDQVVNSK